MIFNLVSLTRLQTLILFGDLYFFVVQIQYKQFQGRSLENQKLLSERNYTMLFAPKEKGQGLVEYAIILALVAIVVIAVMRLLGPRIGNTFSNINSALPS